MSAVMEKRAGARIARVLNNLLLALVSLICLLPFVHMIAKSFSGAAAVSAGRVTFYPINFTLNTYRYVLQDSLFFSSFRNSVMITVGGTLLSLTFTVLAAYPLSKQHLRGRRVILLLYVFTMLFYGGMVSIYVFMRTLNLLNTLACQIIPLLVSQYNLFVMKTFFEGIPESIEESAHIDGAGRLKRIWHIDIPTILPTIVIQLILAVGNIMGVGFEKVYLMQNPVNLDVAEIISTFVYKRGMTQFQYSYASAVGLFNSVINLILIVLANTFASKVGSTSLF